MALAAIQSAPPDASLRTPPPPRRRRLPVFWVGFLAVALFRALVAFSRYDEWRGEELYQGSLAWALLRGMPLDPAELPIIVHLRGSVVFAGLAAPFFAVLGPSYAALKAVAIGWSGLAGGLLAYVVERGLAAARAELFACARRRAAWCAVALACVLPPAYLMVDVCAYGSHMDSVVPPLAALALIVARPGPLGWRRATALGLALGFGAFFSLQCVVATPAVLLAWWGADRGFWRRRASLGILAAALPAAFIPVVSRSSTLVNKGMADHLLPDGLAGAVAKLGDWLSGDAVRVLLFDLHGGAWAGWAYAAAAAVALVLVVPRALRREPLALFALAHPLLVFGAWVGSDFELNLDVRLNGMGSRYLMPTMPALAIALVLASQTLRGRLLWAARLLLFAPLAAGAAGTASMLDARPVLELPPRLGTRFARFEMHFRHTPDWRERLRLARRVDPGWDAYRPLSYRVLAPEPAAGRAPGAPPPPAAWEAVGRLAADERPYALVAMGSRSIGASGPATLRRALDAVPPAVDDAAAAWYHRGVGRAVMLAGLTAMGQGKLSIEGVYGVLGALDGPGRRDVWLGAGFRLGQLFTPYNENPWTALEAARGLPAEARASFFLGVGLGWRLRFRAGSYAAPEPGAAKIERALDGADRAAFRRGVEAPTSGADAFGPKG